MSPRKPTRRERQHVFFDAEVIEEWLQYYRSTQGMYARKWGKSVILGRKELDPNGEIVDDDRLKLTRDTPRRHSLRAKDWKGRWMNTGMEGELLPMLDFIRKSIPHQVQAFEHNRAAEDPKRTSGTRHQLRLKNRPAAFAPGDRRERGAELAKHREGGPILSLRRAPTRILVLNVQEHACGQNPRRGCGSLRSRRARDGPFSNRA